MEYTLIILTFLIVIYLSVKVLTLEGRIKNINYTLNQLAKQSGTLENQINEELRQLIIEGKDVKAVKKARETLGLSLIEGKKYIDELKSSHR
ncbi:hypothetical protein QA612_22255 [Evansella sp. AB-P1]|uniref:hypothetical protein n=1 Tax=Evansella sp. AB-P1 TaxID=3037653 RepID=UPI00241F25B4|nr:hypothetical protein [Evansella sp. AB-P1]MDG5790166.1 hypothetical protein [Evansella sp. AB-P1]